MGWNGPIFMDKIFDGQAWDLPGSLVGTSFDAPSPQVITRMAASRRPRAHVRPPLPRARFPWHGMDGSST